MAGDGLVRTAAALVAMVAIFAALYSASSVFAPIACALLIIAVVWPLQVRLQSHMPRLLAVAIVTLVFAGLIIALSSLAAWGFGRLARELVNTAPQLQLRYEQASVWLENHGIAVVGVWSEYFNVQWLLSTAQQVAGRVRSTLSFWSIVVVYVILGLLEVRDVEGRLRASDNSQALRIVLDGSAIAAAKIRRYMLVRTLMSMATGLLVWVIAWWTGLGLAVEWGVIAFTLNYIPLIGPFIATVLPTVFALAQFASWQMATMLFACLIVAQFTIGSYVEPRVAGKALAISPFVVLFSVFFWTFMWGLFGAFIGVPITIVMLTLCAQHPSSRWIADLLGGNR
jgi:predicted PurR-regulated permease PerM